MGKTEELSADRKTSISELTGKTREYLFIL